MKNFIFENIIKLPNWLNHILVTINVFPTLLYGKKYISYKNKLKQNNNINNKEQLIELVNFAIKNVSYYKNKYNDANITTIDDFVKKIKFIDKNIVMDNQKFFINNNINHDMYDWVTTAGTSGKPLSMLVPKNRYIVELGTVHHFWEKFGFHFSSRIVLRNHKLNKKYFYINPITKEYIFDGFNLTDSNFKEIVKTMQKYHIRFIQCYPSSGYEFIKYLKRKQINTNFIEALFLSSENLYNHQQKLYNELNIPIFCLYGHSEKLVIAGSCPKCNHYHINDLYGYFELVDEKNEVINEPGKKGEIVGTTFYNKGMPLIRYKTGDFAEYIDVDCDNAQNTRTLKYIQGRWSGDKIYNADGSFVTTTALNLHDDIYKTINGIQYVQKIEGELEVDIVPNQLFTEYYEKKIIDIYKKRLSSDTKIIIKKVKALKKQKNGKFLLLISDIKSSETKI